MIGEDGKCPHCNHTKYWTIRRSRRKCRHCRREYRSSWGRTCLGDDGWKQLVECFLSGMSVDRGCKKLGISRYKYLQARTEIRKAMYQSVIDRLGLEGGTGEKLFWKIVLGNEMPTNISVIEADPKNKNMYRVSLVSEEENKFMIYSEDGDYYSLCSIPHISHGKRHVDLMLDSIYYEFQNDEIIKRDLFGKFRMDGLIRKYVLQRKGVTSANLHLYCAEVVWRYRHRGYSRHEKLLRIEKMFKTNTSEK